MRIRRYIPLLFTWILLTLAADAQPAHERALTHARDAVAAMDAGQIQRALQLLDSAIALDPGEASYRYEKAYALMLGNDVPRALAVVEPLLEDTSATDLFFQLAAELHAMRGDTAAAVATLGRGIERLPGAGSLHAQLGGLDLVGGRYARALEHFERGMRAAPAYAENYYHAALLLARSPDPIWGIIYGEIFMNIERNTERTAQMGRLLVETYRRAISAGEDSMFAVRFARSSTAPAIAGSGDPAAMVESMTRPEWLYEMTALQALSVADRCRKQGMTIDCLDQFRAEFTRRWFNQKLDEKFASALFDWHRVLLDVGYLDEYNRWLLAGGDPEAFYTWVDAHAEDYELFQKWFRVNGMVLR